MHHGKNEKLVISRVMATIKEENRRRIITKKTVIGTVDGETCGEKVGTGRRRLGEHRGA